jgi:hypothetical protein
LFGVPLTLLITAVMTLPDASVFAPVHEVVVADELDTLIALHPVTSVPPIFMSAVKLGVPDPLVSAVTLAMVPLVQGTTMMVVVLFWTVVLLSQTSGKGPMEVFEVEREHVPVVVIVPPLSPVPQVMLVTPEPPPPPVTGSGLAIETGMATPLIRISGTTPWLGVPGGDCPEGKPSASAGDDTSAQNKSPVISFLIACSSEEDC